MADAGGGSSWSALEIILVLVLAIGFLTQLQNGFKTPTDTPKASTTPSSTAQTKLPCGLELTRPKSGEKVTTGAVLLTGRVYDCEWLPTESVALYATIVDSKGGLLSAYTPVVPLIYTNASATFDTSIPFTTNPTTSKGFLLLVPAKNASQNTPTYRLPLTFK